MEATDDYVQLSRIIYMTKMRFHSYHECVEKGRREGMSLVIARCKDVKELTTDWAGVTAEIEGSL